MARAKEFDCLNCYKPSPEENSQLYMTAHDGLTPSNALLSFPLEQILEPTRSVSFLFCQSENDLRAKLLRSKALSSSFR
jgi:hypothetical protein